MSIATQKKSKNSRISELVCGGILAVMILATIAVALQAIPLIVGIVIILPATFAMVATSIHYSIKEAKATLSH